MVVIVQCRLPVATENEKVNKQFEILILCKVKYVWINLNVKFEEDCLYETANPIYVWLSQFPQNFIPMTLKNSTQ